MSVTSTLLSKPNWRDWPPEAKQRFLERLKRENDAAGGIEWTPFPGPQTLAYRCDADELFYGGAAGGGKTDLILGLALTAHRNTLICRREYPQLRQIVERSREIIGEAGSFNANDNLWRLADGRRLEFGAVQRENDKTRFQGRPHDLKAFDELPGFTKSQYQFLIAWNRTDAPGQRCRVVGTGNPPMPGQGGEWIFELWAPWLDPHFAHPAAPGELRWFVQLGDGEEWVDGPEPVERGGKILRPRSRTFVKALVDDNPVYMATGYDAILESLPEPLRSQLRYGDFAATHEDDPWQVIPTRWVQLAQERWRQLGEAHRPAVILSAVGVDVARGGKDQTVLARRCGNWFAPLLKYPGRLTPDGPAVAALVLQALGEERAPIHIDALAVGTSPLDILRENRLRVLPINFGGKAEDATGQPLTDQSRRYKFRNIRAAAYWKLREALDPENGDDLALPDDRELLGDLCAARYELTASGIALQSKDEIRERIGRSPDCGDALAMAHWHKGMVETKAVTTPSRTGGMRW